LFVLFVTSAAPTANAYGDDAGESTLPAAALELLLPDSKDGPTSP
jgi:hypothetical protein